MTNNFDITNLERVITKILKDNGVSANVYNNRPKSAPKVNDFAIVNVIGSVLDRGTHGTANVGIDLYSKDINNFKNSQRLKVMYETLIDVMPRITSCTDGEYLIDGNPTTLGDAPDDYGFTARLITYKIIIKTA